MASKVLLLVALVWLGVDTLLLLSALEWIRQVSVIAAEAGEQSGTLSVGMDAPTIRGRGLGARDPASRDAILRLRLLLFVTPTCPGCRALAQDLRTKLDRWSVGTDTMLQVVVRESEEQRAREVFGHVEPEASLILDPSGQVFADYRITRIPYLYVIGADNQIIARGSVRDELVTSQLPH